MPIESHFARNVGPSTSKEPKQRVQERRRALERKAREAPIDPEQRLKMVLELRSILQDASDNRRLAKDAWERGDRGSYEQYTAIYLARRQEVEERKNSPQAAGLELAWRAYIRGKVDFAKLCDLRRQKKALERQIRAQRVDMVKIIKNIPVGKLRNESEHARLTARAIAFQEQTEEVTGDLYSPEVISEILGLKATEEMKQAAIKLKNGARQTLGGLEVQLAEVVKQLQVLWGNDIVRMLYEEENERKIRRQVAEGKNVIDLPSTEEIMHTLARHEDEDPTALFGTVLEGPPGSGKTTAVREYCRRNNRNLVEIDLSNEVTRYMFWGSKSSIHDEPLEKFDQLSERLQDLEGDELLNFMRGGVEHFGPTFLQLAEEAADATSSQALEAHLHGELDEEQSKKIMAQAKAMRERMIKVMRERYHTELASEIYKYGKQNGWRAGLLMQALERGDSVLFNEFNKAADLSFVHGVLTAYAASAETAGAEPEQERPGWFYVADAGRWVRLPTITNAEGEERAATKFYFTGNVGTKYRVQNVLGPLASRATGRVIDVGYPPKKEEIDVLTAMIERPDKKPILSNEINIKLMQLWGEVVPMMRAFTKDKPRAIEISFREMHAIVRKMVDRKSGTARLGANLERAIKEVLIDTYRLYDQESTRPIVHELVKALIMHRIFSSERILNQIVDEGWMTKAELDELEEQRKKAAEAEELRKKSPVVPATAPTVDEAQAA